MKKSTFGGLPAGISAVYSHYSDGHKVRNICDGDFLYLEAYTYYPAQGFCDSYQWRLNGKDIPGATSDTLTPAVAGTYTCIETNGVGSVASNSLKITKDTMPAVIHASGDTTVCGGPVYLYNEESFGFTYQWQQNGNNILNATDWMYSASTTGKYCCIKTNVCGAETSNTISVTIYPPMADAIITVGNTVVCSGPLVLKANKGQGLTYRWFYNDNSGWVKIPGATGSSYSATASGYYQVKETNSYGCTRTSYSAFLQVGPPIAEFGASSTTICNGNPVTLNAYYWDGTTYSYQWIKDSVDIPGATGRSCDVTQPGTYTLLVTIIQGGCSNIAVSQLITSGCGPRLVISNASQKYSSLQKALQLSVVPNPLSSSTKISFILGHSEKVSLGIFDLNGKLITTVADREFSGDEHELKWNAANVQPGTYVLRMETATNVETRKLVVVK